MERMAGLEWLEWLEWLWQLGQQVVAMGGSEPGPGLERRLQQPGECPSIQRPQLFRDLERIVVWFM